LGLHNVLVYSKRVCLDKEGYKDAGLAPFVIQHVLRLVSAITSGNSTVVAIYWECTKRHSRVKLGALDRPADGGHVKVPYGKCTPLSMMFHGVEALFA